MPLSALVSTLMQGFALLILGLLGGSMFAVWRGYELGRYSPATFVETHQGAVRGLNDLLPAMGIATAVLVVALAVLARSRPSVLMLYLAVVVLVVIAGLVTRLANQPINDQVMSWTAATLPANWQELRDKWWNWHMVRLCAAMLAQIALIAAVFTDRGT